MTTAAGPLLGRLYVRFRTSSSPFTLRSAVKPDIDNRATNRPNGSFWKSESWPGTATVGANRPTANGYSWPTADWTLRTAAPQNPTLIAVRRLTAPAAIAATLRTPRPAGRMRSLEQQARQDQPEGHGQGDEKRRRAVRDRALEQVERCLVADRHVLMRALAAWNRKSPGIIETTAENPSAANGRCRRSAAGVMMMPARKQAPSAPVATCAPASEISAQRTACTSMPTAIGTGSRSHGIEKKVPKAATAHPAAITSAPKGTGTDGATAGRLAPPAARPSGRPVQIMSTVRPA